MFKNTTTPLNDAIKYFYAKMTAMQSDSETKLVVNSKFSVRAGEFEGPLDLLLDLIEKRKLHISQVSLSQVADEFIEHTKSFEDFPIKDSSDFILIASTLLLLKSKSLLPTLELSTEEEQNIEELERRIALYKEYKEASKQIAKIFGNFLYFARDRKQKEVVFNPTAEITLENLKQRLSEVLESIPKPQVLPKISVAKIISLEEMIGRLSERIEKNLKMSFSSFSGRGGGASKEDKINVIVSFLAMLELVKRGALRVKQESSFDEIEMETDEVLVPKY